MNIGKLLSKTGAGLCAAVVFLCASGTSLNAQFNFPGVTFSRGQDVSPIFEGWQSNPDGSFTLHFGYYNRNSEEALDVPIGPNNNFDMGNPDQGQPTHFYPGRHWFVFKVVVPKDWPTDKRAVWTLINRDHTNLAKGWLQPEWEVDNELITKNAVTDRTLMIWNTTPPPENTPPVVTGSSAQTISLPDTVTLTATATDDGIPKPSGKPGRNGRPQGLTIRWIQYRGAGKVRFDPEIGAPGYGQPVTSQTKVSFSEPGTYRIRALASDGSLFSTYDVDVQVNPGTSAQNSR